MLRLVRRRRWRIAALSLVAATAVLIAIAASRSRLEAPAPTLLLLDRHEQFLAELPGSDELLGYWPVDELPPRVVAATLALEDRRFSDHLGVDPIAVARAAIQNLRTGRRVSGASTIAMQVARLQNPGRRTWPRKVVEAMTAPLLVLRHGRDRVLAQYLLLAPYGNRIRGVRYAARRYFGKPIADLSWAQTAFLAALPQAPSRMNPYRHHGRRQAIERAHGALTKLAAEGTLSAADLELARRELDSLDVRPRPRRPLDALHAVIQLRTRAERGELSTSDPLVRTSLDLALQRRVAQHAFDRLEQWQPRGAGNAAAIVIDHTTSEVLAWLGSTGYFDRTWAGAIDFTQVERASGSTLKPFLYALALESGAITAATILDDIERAPGAIENSDRTFLGPLLPRMALANSRNVPAALLLQRLGLTRAFDGLRALGLHDGSDTAARYGLGLAIGSLPLTLERLVRAYRPLAADGLTADFNWLHGTPPSHEQRVLSATAARLVTAFLADPLARLPTFPRMGINEYPFPVAIKTGTTSSYHDAWTIGYTRRFLVGVWIGHPGHRPMNGLSGYRTASVLVRDIITDLHKDELNGFADRRFPPPDGHRSIPLCAASGELATDSCPRVVDEWFPDISLPLDRCSIHFRIAAGNIASNNSSLTNSSTGAPQPRLRPVEVLPQRYARWAAQNVHGHQTPALDLPPAREHRVRIVEPHDGARMVRDLETPSALATLALDALVEPPVAQVVWYVDGEPFQVVAHPYTTRWPLTAGEHTFEVRIPFEERTAALIHISVD